MRVLVVGASGFVGRHVAEALVHRQAEVGLAVRDPDRLAPALRTLPVLQVDCVEPGALAAAVARWRPAVLFQLAGYGVARHERDPGLMQRLNCDLPGEAAAALAACPQPDWPGLRLVHAGSAFEYGALSVPLDEAALPAPTTDYGRSKLAGTELLLATARRHGLPALVARLFTVFGPGERDGRLFPTLLAARRHQQPVALSSGEQRRDFTLVWDVADALLDLALAPAAAVLTGTGPFDAGTLNLASGRLHTVRAFATAAADALGIAPSRLRFGELPAAGEPPHPPVPTTRLQQALGRTLPGELAELMGRVAARLGRAPG